ncbi:glycosyltransferase [Hymenobacter profundi]|uniref:Glycosyltransferase n=1 Tax=Hymenobacter profundi TaxID=1982110 RepID=A0ABS6WTS7_9BACT|nr:glycosyltransferase [Hymenobacter profundi]MBW3126980.1 glycosyltransferase [Hymenobacter profundi]MBW3127029.1 glycosyltransferase [Hymenobacter profundi]
MPPTTILLASVLKPLDDTRMFGKFGRTLAERLGIQVHVAGRRAPHPPGAPTNLHTHELLAGSRLSWQRLAAQWRYWQLLRQLRPQLVFVHAPELLPLTRLWCSQGRERHFIYDVRENYALNILTQQVYPHVLRQLLAKLVRRIETAATRRAAALVLAERSYAEELPFATLNNSVILENKYQPPPNEPASAAPHALPMLPAPLELLYSGTISELNGVFDAIAFTHAFRQVWPTARLTIIGFCQQPEVLRRLQQAVTAAPEALTLLGGDQLVPHREVVRVIQRSHLGLLPYQPHPSSWRCVPTKLFEYAAHGLPMLLPYNALWLAATQAYTAALPCADFAQPNATALAADLRATRFYPHGIPTDVFWASEAAKLWSVVDAIR